MSLMASGNFHLDAAAAAFVWATSDSFSTSFAYSCVRMRLRISTFSNALLGDGSGVCVEFSSVAPACPHVMPSKTAITGPIN